jgi:hypothetical protein
MRRKTTAIAVLTIGLLAAGCGQPRQAEPPPLVGAWRSAIHFRSGAFAGVDNLEFMYVFNAGGTLTESSNYDGAPPVPPAYGEWRRLGPNEFEAKYEFYATAPPESFDVLKGGGGWLPTGRGVLTERIMLSEDARSFTSTIRYEARDSKGSPIEGGGEADGRGQRIGF